VATPGGGFLAINCTDANGETLAGIAGDVYKGMVYVNYTETDTGLVKVIAVKYIAKYEP